MKKKTAAKTEGEGECFAAGPLRASGRNQQYNRGLIDWFHEVSNFSETRAPQNRSGTPGLTFGLH